MSEELGNGQQKKSLVESVRSALGDVDDSLLRDLESDYPNLRKLLLGHKSESETCPGGSLLISRGPRGIRVNVSLPALSCQAVYSFRSWAEMWDTIENDLALGTTPWELSYRERQKQLASQLKALQGKG